MGASLADTATSGLLNGMSGILIVLGDMPFVSRETLCLLVDFFVTRFCEGMVLRPQFNDEAGHPVLFDESYLPGLKRLSGDEGARSLIRVNPGKLVCVPVKDAGVIRDINLPEDLFTGVSKA